jgi:hypothetical protein
MQGRFTVPLPTTTAQACVVCAEPVDWRLPLTPRKGGSSRELYPLCLEAACRWLFNELGGLPDAEFRRHLHARGQPWREEKLRLRRRRERARAEIDETEAAFAAIGSAGLEAPPDLRLVVPSGRGAARPLSKRRRKGFAAHIDAIIAAALEPVDPAPDEPESANPMSPDSEVFAGQSRLPGRLCGVCAGGCCTRGGDKAYLSGATIRRVLAEDPGLDPEGLRGLYLDHVPPRTVFRSCVYHTRQGCNLPRSLRADICNRYACKSLTALLTNLHGDPPVRAVVVLRRRQSQWDQDKPTLDNAVVAAAVLTETDTRPLEPPTPADRDIQTRFRNKTPA